MKSTIDVNIHENQLFLDVELYAGPDGKLGDKMLRKLLSLSSSGLMLVSPITPDSYTIAPVHPAALLSVLGQSLEVLCESKDIHDKVIGKLNEIVELVNSIPAEHVNEPVTPKVTEDVVVDEKPAKAVSPTKRTYPSKK